MRNYITMCVVFIFMYLYYLELNSLNLSILISKIIKLFLEFFLTLLIAINYREHCNI